MVGLLARVRRPAAISFGALLFYLGIAILTSQPLSSHPAEYLPNNADSVVFSWGIAWVCHQIAHHPLALFQANVFHPNPGALAYGEPLVGVAAIAWPFWALTGNDVVTFNATFVLTLALNGLTMFWLARRITGNPWAALLAGEIFAFTTGNYDSAGRIQIVSTQWTPLLLLFLVRLLDERRVRDAVGLGLAFALQGLACDYYELYVATLMAASAPVYLVASRPPRLGALPWKQLALSVGIAALCLLPVNLNQYRYLRQIDSARETAHFARLAEYWKALPTNWVYGSLLGAPERPFDHRHFVGVLPLLLGALGVALAFSRSDASDSGGSKWRWPFLCFGACAALLACGPTLPTPWGGLTGPYQWLVDFVPGYSQVRVATRYLPFVRLAIAVFAAIGLARAGGGLGRVARCGGVLALAILLPLEHVAVPLPAWRVSSGDRVPEVYRWLATVEPGTPIVEFPPYPQRRRMSEPFWQHFSTVHWLPLVNGFSSYFPASQDFVYDELLDFPSQRGLVVLRALGVQYLVFHPRAVHTPEQRRAVRRFLRLAPRYSRALTLVKTFDDDARHYPDDNGSLGLGREAVFALRAGPGAPRPPGPALVPVPRTGWTCDSEPQGGCAQAFDGDLRTAFSTGKTQREGDYVRFVFPAPLSVKMVSLHCGKRGNFYPRAPGLSGLVEGRWVPLESHSDAAGFLEALLHGADDAAMNIAVLDAAPVSGIEVRLGPASRRFNPWLLPEIEVFR